MVKIGEIVNQNPWWKYGKDFTGFDADLLELHQQRVPVERKSIDLKQGDIGIIRGCRQIGKTTYMKTYVERLTKEGIEPRRIMYLSVDRFFASRRELRRAINYFLGRNRDADKVFILLDEITAIKDWNLELKFLSDSGITRKAMILVTGSSGETLRRIGEQLPGRGLEGNEFYMKPLNFREFIFRTARPFAARVESSELSQGLQLLEKTLKEAAITLQEDLGEIMKLGDLIMPFKSELEYLFEHYLRCGGFPIAINRYLENFVTKKKAFFEPDLSEIFIRTTLGELTKYGKNETTARQILKEIINRYSTRFSFTKLAGDLAVSHPTTSEYLEFLENSFVLSVLYAYDFNKKDLKYKGSKKAYFQDPFIFYSLKSSLTGQGINDVIRESLDDEELVSEIIEGIVFSHLSMTMEIPYLKEKNTFLWFYYDTRGKELDNVLKRNGIHMGIEVKYQNDVRPGDATTIPGIDECIILSKEDFSEGDGIIVIPTEVFLSLLDKSSHNL